MNKIEKFINYTLITDTALIPLDEALKTEMFAQGLLEIVPTIKYKNMVAQTSSEVTLDTALAAQRAYAELATEFYINKPARVATLLKNLPAASLWATNVWFKLAKLIKFLGCVPYHYVKACFYTNTTKKPPNLKYIINVTPEQAQIRLDSYLVSIKGADPAKAGLLVDVVPQTVTDYTVGTNQEKLVKIKQRYNCTDPVELPKIIIGNNLCSLFDSEYLHTLPHFTETMEEFFLLQKEVNQYMANQKEQAV